MGLTQQRDDVSHRNLYKPLIMQLFSSFLTSRFLTKKASRKREWSIGQFFNEHKGIWKSLCDF